MRDRCGLKPIQSRSLVVLLAALAVTALLAACGSAESTATPTATVVGAVAEPTPTATPEVRDIAGGQSATPTPVGERPIYGGILRADFGVPFTPDPQSFAHYGGFGVG